METIESAPCKCIVFERKCDRYIWYSYANVINKLYSYVNMIIMHMVKYYAQYGNNFFARNNKFVAFTDLISNLFSFLEYFITS